MLILFISSSNEKLLASFNCAFVRCLQAKGGGGKNVGVINEPQFSANLCTFKAHLYNGVDHCSIPNALIHIFQEVTHVTYDVSRHNCFPYVYSLRQAAHYFLSRWLKFCFEKEAVIIYPNMQWRLRLSILFMGCPCWKVNRRISIFLQPFVEYGTLPFILTTSVLVHISCYNILPKK